MLRMAMKDFCSEADDLQVAQVGDKVSGFEELLLATAAYRILSSKLPMLSERFHQPFLCAKGSCYIHPFGEWSSLPQNSRWL